MLYALPTVRQICKAEGQEADFYTSDYCFPVVERLLNRQSYIRKSFISPGYIIERMDIGVQPWQMNVDGEYNKVYQLGFRGVPDGPIPGFIAKSAGIVWDGEISYDCDDFPTLDEDYIVIAPRGLSSFQSLFLDVIAKSPVKSVVIGGKSDYIGAGIDKCGLDLLETLPWIAKSKGFLGLMSSQLVLANGFNIPRIAPHDGIHWDMRHVIHSKNNHYPVNPTAKNILKILGLS